MRDCTYCRRGRVSSRAPTPTSSLFFSLSAILRRQLQNGSSSDTPDLPSVAHDRPLDDTPICGVLLSRNVRFGSLADLGLPRRIDGRVESSRLECPLYPSKADIRQCTCACPLCAKCGHRKLARQRHDHADQHITVEVMSCPRSFIHYRYVCSVVWGSYPARRWTNQITLVQLPA